MFKQFGSNDFQNRQSRRYLAGRRMEPDLPGLAVLEGPAHTSTGMSPGSRKPHHRLGGRPWRSVRAQVIGAVAGDAAGALSEIVEEFKGLVAGPPKEE